MFQFRHHASLIVMVTMMLLSIGGGGGGGIAFVAAFSPTMHAPGSDISAAQCRRGCAHHWPRIGPCTMVSTSTSTTTTTRLAWSREEQPLQDSIMQQPAVDSCSSPMPLHSTTMAYSSGEPVRLMAATGALLAMVVLVAMTIAPNEALAAVTVTTASSSSSNVVAAVVNTNVVQNALVAYGHYLGLLLVTALLTYERVTVQAQMSVETEKSLVIADALYGLTALFLFGTGYLRATEFGKGWDFYAHEPFFWLKLASGGILAGLSLFPTITFIRRGRVLFTDNTADKDWEPMSDALATRLHKIINAELTAIVTMPLLATLMARGVGYMDGFPWPAGAALTAATLVGSSVLYARQALTWVEPITDNYKETN
jgi:putative membrane protein